MTYQSKPCVECGDFAFETYHGAWLCYPCRGRRRMKRYQSVTKQA